VTALRACSIALLAGFSAACAPVGGPPPAPVRHAIVATTPTAAERAFMTRVAANWLYEMEVSRLAAARATNPRVRSYAQALAGEHQRAHAELVALMQAKGVPVPAGLAADKATKLHRLSALRPSADFDLGYVRVLGVEDHAAAIALFERAQRESRDRDLRAWIDRMLPVLRGRLAAAQKLTGTLSS
jgi:putative membrane protein